MSGKSLYDLTKSDIRKTTVSILVPAKEQMHSNFAFCLANLIKTTNQFGVNTTLFFDYSTILLNQRENLIEMGIEEDSEWVMWLDSDMWVPDTTILRLLEHKKDIVAGNYMKRSFPFKSVAFKKFRDWDSWIPLTKKDKLEEAEVCGLGCVLMKTSLFKELKKPYFEYDWQEDTESWGGEDFMLFRKLKEMGNQLYIDMVLSEEIKHIGTFAFGSNLAVNKQQIKKFLDK